MTALDVDTLNTFMPVDYGHHLAFLSTDMREGDLRAVIDYHPRLVMLHKDTPERLRREMFQDDDIVAMLQASPYLDRPRCVDSQGDPVECCYDCALVATRFLNEYPEGDVE